MKTCYYLCAIFLCALVPKFTLAQCELNPEIIFEPAICFGEVSWFTVVPNTNCPDGAYMDVMIIVDDDTSYYSYTNLFETTYWTAFFPVVSVCAEYSVYDASDNLLATASDCISDFWVDTPPMNIEITTVENNCADQCFFINVQGGNLPYTIYYIDQYLDWNGGNDSLCIDNPGIYDVAVIDANGCEATIVLEVNPSGEQQNISCETATELENEVVLSEIICDTESPNPGCNLVENGIMGWYSFNSGNAASINIGAFSWQEPYYLEVFMVPDGSDCSQLQSVFCSSAIVYSYCFYLEDVVTIEPNTNYYIQVEAAATQSFSLDIAVRLGESTVDPVCGCLSPLSCDYAPQAIIQQYPGCGQAGCMDPLACNYSSYSECDDGSCFFGNNLNVQLFHDLDADGIMDQGFFGEPILSAGYITILENGYTAYPDADGQIAIPNLEFDTYTLVYTDPNNVWEAQTAEVTTSIPSCTGITFGLAPIDNDMMLQVSGPCCIWMMDIHCENGFNPGLWVQNTGSVPLNGTFIMTFDPIFEATNLSGAQPYDSFIDGVMTWNIVDQAPGSSVLYQTHIVGPGVELMGQTFDYNMYLTLEDGQGGTFYEGSWLLQPTVVCGYDPNDKYAVPAGYAEPHFVLAEDEIEYRIRFQNTGNAPTNDVRIEDDLDMELLDLSTFYPVFASHSFSTIVEPDGHVEFHFDSINLPDSTSDEPGSQGYVVYRIKSKPTAEGWDEINNTAYIYFDSNPAIVTNTTWHTIYDCAWLPELPSFDVGCEGTYNSLDLSAEYVTNYEWTLDGVSLGVNASQVDIDDLNADVYTLGLIISNPLCSIASLMELNIDAYPGNVITQNGSVLNAPDGAQWTWFLNGEVIVGAASQTYIPTEAGVYTVGTTSTNGCYTLSQGITIVDVGEFGFLNMNVYPNPSKDEVMVELPMGSWEITIVNTLGEICMQRKNASGRSKFDLNRLAAGAYHVRATSVLGEVLNAPLQIRP